MLGFYIKSVIVYLIIFWALKRFTKTIISNREDINFRNYATGKKGMYYIFCFIPILRVIALGTVFFVSFAKKETIEKILNKESK